MGNVGGVEDMSQVSLASGNRRRGVYVAVGPGVCGTSPKSSSKLVDP